MKPQNGLMKPALRKWLAFGFLHTDYKSVYYSPRDLKSLGAEVAVFLRLYIVEIKLFSNWF